MKIKEGDTVNRATIQGYIDQRVEERKGVFHSSMQDQTHFEINKHPYEVVHNYRNAFDLDAFTDRFSMILSKYDYIVGDWGYDQLRLRGFYDSHNPLYSPDRGVNLIQDYLYEECNFGCAYFILHNLDVNVQQHRHHKRRVHKSHHAYQEKRTKLTQPNLKQRRHQKVERVRQGRKPHFVIKQRGSHS